MKRQAKTARCSGSGHPGYIRTHPDDQDRCPVCGKWVKQTVDGDLYAHAPLKRKAKI